MNVWGWGRINDLAHEVHGIARDKGFWGHEKIGDGDNPSIWAEKLALMHSEVSEILEARRDGDEDLELEECADVVIRVLDYCQARGFTGAGRNIEQAIVNKIEKNRGRERMHGRGNG